RIARVHGGRITRIHVHRGQRARIHGGRITRIHVHRGQRARVHGGRVARIHVHRGQRARIHGGQRVRRNRRDAWRHVYKPQSRLGKLLWLCCCGGEEFPGGTNSPSRLGKLLSLCCCRSTSSQGHEQQKCCT